MRMQVDASGGSWSASPVAPSLNDESFFAPYEWEEKYVFIMCSANGKCK